MITIIWLVVWNNFYFSIFLEESSQLTFIFFRGVETTNQCTWVSQLFDRQSFLEEHASQEKSLVIGVTQKNWTKLSNGEVRSPGLLTVTKLDDPPSTVQQPVFCICLWCVWIIYWGLAWRLIIQKLWLYHLYSFPYRSSMLNRSNLPTPKRRKPETAETLNAEGTSHEASKKDEETLETKAFRCKYRWQLGRNRICWLISPGVVQECQKKEIIP